MSSKSLPTLSHAEAASFCSQMALILKSGISSLEGISIMLEDTNELNEKKLLTQIYETMIRTGNFHESLTAAKVFPDYLLQMVKIGEQTGKLDEVMGSLADYYEREANLADTIRHAVSYPLIMAVMMAFVILVLITKVMPVFYQVFQQLGSEMTGFSRMLLLTGEFLNRHVVLFLGILAALVLLLVFLTKSAKGQTITRAFFYRFSKTRELSDQISAYRFSNGMALTLSSGLTPDECLQQTLLLTEPGPFRHRLDTCLRLVSEGEELCHALLEQKIFTDIYARMAVIGSKTGVLDEVMHTISMRYETDIDEKFSGMIAKVEPALVIALSLIVGGILLSVMLPLMGILSSL